MRVRKSPGGAGLEQQSDVIIIATLLLIRRDLDSRALCFPLSY